MKRVSETERRHKNNACVRSTDVKKQKIFNKLIIAHRKENVKWTLKK